MRVILDTDIGTDVDDCLALALLLAAPQIHLEAITCVYADVALRGRMVQRLLDLAGRSDVPVALGASQPLLGLRPLFWGGHEGQGLLDREARLRVDVRHASDVIIDLVRANPGEIQLLAIGPLTNVALAFLKAPEIAGMLAGLTIMGGVLRNNAAFELPPAEHNIICDPEAADIVLRAGVRVRLIPLDVTTQVQIDRAGLAQIAARDTPFHRAVAQQLADYPPFAARGWTHLHDPLAAAALLDPTLCQWTPLHVAVETGGRHAVGATIGWVPRDDRPANADVALDLDAAHFVRWYVEHV